MFVYGLAVSVGQQYQQWGSSTPRFPGLEPSLELLAPCLYFILYALRPDAFFALEGCLLHIYELCLRQKGCLTHCAPCQGLSLFGEYPNLLLFSYLFFESQGLSLFREYSNLLLFSYLFLECPPVFSSS